MFARALPVILCASTMLVACNDPAVEPEVPSSITGVVVAIEDTGIEEVTGFTLRSSGDEYEILIDPEVEYGFPLGHLRAHLREAAPVKVEISRRDGKLYARSIVDA